MPGAATIELVEMLEQAGPYGAGAPGPRFAFADMQIFFAKRVGESHLKVTFGDVGGARMDAISFGAYDGPLGPALENHGGARFHLAGRLDINSFGANRPYNCDSKTLRAAKGFSHILFAFSACAIASFA